VSFTIRATREEDWPLVRALRIENATDNPISYGATLETTLSMTENDWRLRARRGQQEHTIALAAVEASTQRWIGMMQAQEGDDDGSHAVLTGVYVTPDFRGRPHGVADALLARILNWASPRSPRLRLYVHEDAAPARRFYSRHRFAPTGRARPHPYAAGLQLEMARPLPSAPRSPKA
jgi:ribosomal protein S18 acetylase RimI-like enzyme